MISERGRLFSSRGSCCILRTHELAEDGICRVTKLQTKMNRAPALMPNDANLALMRRPCV